jgi:hypothetical protein
MHGDFWFGNVYVRRGTCAALDWEFGTECGFPYLDAAHWLYAVASIIQHQSPVTARTNVASRLAQYLPDHHRRFASTIVALSALSQLIAWYPRARMDNDVERWLRAFVQETNRY